MRLLLRIPEESRTIRVILIQDKTRWEAEANTGEALLEVLDKTLKKAKIDLYSLTGIRVLSGKKSSLTSVRLAKTFQQALTIAMSTKPRK